MLQAQGVRRRRNRPPADRTRKPQSAPPLQPIYPEYSGPGTTPPAPEAREEAPPPEVPEPAAPGEPVPAAAAPDQRRSRRRRKRGGRGRQRSGAAPQAQVPEAPPPTPEPEPVEAPPAPVTTPTAAVATKARPARGNVVLAIGLPGSGKSSWFRRRGITPLSSDLLRTLLFDNIAEQRYQDLVFSTLRSLLRARLIARMPWNYVDATNLSPKERRGWIKMAHEFGYEMHAVYFDVPLEVCQERNRRRQRIVPDDVMQRMATKLRPPTFEEGFSKITVVRVKRSQEPSPEQPAESPHEELREEEQPEDF